MTLTYTSPKQVTFLSVLPYTLTPFLGHIILSPSFDTYVYSRIDKTHHTYTTRKHHTIVSLTLARYDNQRRTMRGRLRRRSPGNASMRS